jgi:hypothetical protein
MAIRVVMLGLDTSEVSAGFMEELMEVGKEGFTEVVSWGAEYVLVSDKPVPTYEGMDEDIKTLVDYFSDRSDLELIDGFTLKNGVDVEVVW